MRSDINNNRVSRLENNNNSPYLKVSIFKHSMLRAPWLIVLMLSSTISSLIISSNDYILCNNVFGVLLTSSIPMIMGTAGNAAGQSSTTIIRSLALAEISFNDIFKVVLKEFKIGLLLSIFLGFVCFLKILLIDGMLFGISGVNVYSCYVISLSLSITIIISKIFGCILPLICKKFKADPTVIATPLITTIIDILSLLFFCKFAQMLLFI